EQAGRCTLEAAPGAVLARGATDSCAMHLVAAGLEPGAWSLSLGTTVTWKAAIPSDSPDVLDRLPRGAYGHRIAADAWLAAAAGNSGGGVLRATIRLPELDSRARFPSGFAAYPLARPGDRFPIADPAFTGFGVPDVCDERLHAALLEGVAFVARLGVDRLTHAGVTTPQSVVVTGGGARSSVWMRVLASVLAVDVVALPDSGPAMGAALLAAAAADRATVKEVRAAVAQTPAATQAPDPGLAAALAERYTAFTKLLQIVT
ncbi:MAG: FGGY-family carbohydrate kinase, partial [Candidatus Dormibacteria bacterium]